MNPSNVVAFAHAAGSPSTRTSTSTIRGSSRVSRRSAASCRSATGRSAEGLGENHAQLVAVRCAGVRRAPDRVEGDAAPRFVGPHGRARGRVVEHHHVTSAEVPEPMRLETRREVHRPAVRRRRPDVRPPAQDGEQRERLGQPAVEASVVVGPADARHAVPERIRVHADRGGPPRARGRAPPGRGWRGRASRGARGRASWRRRWPRDGSRGHDTAPPGAASGPFHVRVGAPPHIGQYPI